MHLFLYLGGVWLAGILVLVLGQLGILAADAIWRWRMQRRALRALRESRVRFMAKVEALALERKLSIEWNCGRPDCQGCNPPKEMRN